MNKIGLSILIQLIETNYYDDENCYCKKCDKKWFSIQDYVETPIDTKSLV